jgi:hypothetical protein
MPALVAGMHVLIPVRCSSKRVDGRTSPAMTMDIIRLLDPDLNDNVERTLATWLAVELETIAGHCHLSLALESRFILSDDEIAGVAKGFSTCGLQSAPREPCKARAP